jgi:hypothetical protein
MTRRSRIVWVILGLLVFYAGLWGMSQWWEKALAKRDGAADYSPDGCFRVQLFKPFWLLPSSFHPQSPPDGSLERSWFVRWEYPRFFRLYDNRNDQVLGESEIYDLVAYGAPLRWGHGSDLDVSAGMIEIGTTTADCSFNRQGVQVAQSLIGSSALASRAALPYRTLKQWIDANLPPPPTGSSAMPNPVR